jgi:hypothetical protein
MPITQFAFLIYNYLIQIQMSSKESPRAHKEPSNLHEDHSSSGPNQKSSMVEDDLASQVSRKRDDKAAEKLASNIENLNERGNP